MQQRSNNGCIYFITCTCYKWKPLFSITNSYDAVYKWFDYLSGRGCSIIGYVILPNHLHALIHLPVGIKNLNTIIGNGKRFMAYEIVKRLEEQKAEPLLQELYHGVKDRERKKGQRHRVFEESFDAKECYSKEFIEQKLLYMHHNPIKGKWNLVSDFAMYEHSSAGFYYDTGANLYKMITRVEDIREEVVKQVNPGVSPQG